MRERVIRVFGPFYKLEHIAQLLNDMISKPEIALEFEYPAFRFDLSKTELHAWQVVLISPAKSYPIPAPGMLQLLIDFSLEEREEYLLNNPQ